ncbi:MAG: CotH kinase family protein [Bacteroidales bacterium]|nr:CotH kinase family protein [Bacteroidales bacterium]
MSSNVSKLFDEDNDTPDWFELYNSGITQINLEGYRITDNDTFPDKWVFPAVSLNPGEFLLIYASGKDIKTPQLIWQTIVDMGDHWNYLVPDNVTPGNWKNSGFDDSAWPSGPSGFGYGDEDDSTIVPDGTMSVYQRYVFTVGDKSDISDAILHMDYDDGFVAYLNGVELVRANIGQPGSVVSYNQPADGAIEPFIVKGNPPAVFYFDSISKLLVNGDNVLAVEVHNAGSGSSDLTSIPFFSLGYNYLPDAEDSISEYISINQNRLHTNFKISSRGESLMFSNAAGDTVDYIVFGPIPSDVSFGRQPDGHNTWGFFTESTPESANNTTMLVNDSIGIPGFSHPGGIYSNTIELVLSCAEGDTIYYTTDGSVPDYSSEIYTAPLSLSFSGVIKAKILRQGSMPGQLAVNTYIIGADHNLPIVSVSTNPENLWDYNTGIYVEGPNANSADPHYGANYWNDWEKPAHIEFYEKSGLKAFELDAGIKIIGAWSRMSDQKSLAVIARKKYGTNKIPYKIFQDKHLNEFKSLVLRNSGNDWNNTMFRDAMMTSLIRDFGVDRQAYRPAVVYLNGEYWGIQNIREKINEHFLAANHNLDPDNISILETNGYVVIGSAADYNNMIGFIEAHDLRIQDNYEFVKSQMDVNNYINYQLSEIYFDNTDWPGNNIKFWKENSSNGKWRWIIFDTDHGFGPWDVQRYDHNTLEFALADDVYEWPNPTWSTYLFRSLMLNNEFKNDFINLFCDRLNTTFLPEKVKQHIDSLKQGIEDEIVAHLYKWNGSYDYWASNVTNMKTFAQNRQQKVFGHIAGEFDLNPAKTIILNVNNSAFGRIKVNTIVPENYPWNGKYFGGVPFTITAMPRPDYRFTGWTGYVNSTAQSLEVNLTMDKIYTANFEYNGNTFGPVVINEINYNSLESKNTGDWVELYNISNVPLNLQYWKLRDATENSVFIFTEATIIKSGDFLVVCKDTSKFKSLYPEVPCIGNFPFGLSSLGDAVQLFDYKNQLIDSVYYLPVSPWPENANGTGATLELMNPENDNALAIHWKSSEMSTPGAENNCFTSINQVYDNTQSIEKLESVVYPNPFTSHVTIGFTIESNLQVKLTVFDINGNIVKLIETQILSAGYHELQWKDEDSDNSHVSPGMYIYKLELGDKISIGKILKQ